MSVLYLFHAKDWTQRPIPAHSQLLMLCLSGRRETWVALIENLKLTLLRLLNHYLVVTRKWFVSACAKKESTWWSILSLIKKIENSKSIIFFFFVPMRMVKKEGHFEFVQSVLFRVVNLLEVKILGVWLRMEFSLHCLLPLLLSITWYFSSFSSLSHLTYLSFKSV